jgi:hypothetical protein
MPIRAQRCRSVCKAPSFPVAHDATEAEPANRRICSSNGIYCALTSRAVVRMSKETRRGCWKLWLLGRWAGPILELLILRCNISISLLMVGSVLPLGFPQALIFLAFYILFSVQDELVCVLDFTQFILSNS